MRYYIIINGVNSLTIPGLAIRTLPPISKPVMRNIREEIDGRDGDITTELGYGAYDRPLEIGLFGDYDINKIIAFFNSKGKIIFSDEPDKYYNFEIVDKIDYTKLVKFRTATINIHCQPFKYPVSEEPHVEEYEYVEATGTNITLDNTSEAIFNKIDLLGSASQDGTPTPSSPIPVNVVSGDNTIDICGKNLLQLEDRTGTSAGITYTIKDGVITFNGTATGNGALYIGINKTFTRNECFSRNIEGSSSGINNPMQWVRDGSTKYTFNSLFQSGDELKQYYFTWASGATANNYVVKPMLEVGTTNTTYEPYQGASYSVNLGSLELCKIGDYQDYIYKDNGSWYLHKEITKYIFTGNETGILQNSGKRFDITCSANNMPICVNNSASSEISQIYCNILLASSGASTWGGNQGISYNTGTNGQILVSISGVTTKQAYLSALKDNYCYYILATPTNTLIEDTTLQEQLEALWNANSYRGQTNITQTNNDAPFILDLSVLKEGSDHLVINNAGNIYAKPTMDIEGTGVVDIYLNDVQILEADLTETNNIVIDTEAMEAYNPDTNALANRQVTGDYSKIKLEPGDNDLRFSGALSKATITDYTRWL